MTLNVKFRGYVNFHADFNLNTTCHRHSRVPHGKGNVIVMCEHLLLVIAFVLTPLMRCKSADGNDEY